MTRVVIDPGVLVSAFISPKKAAPALLVDAILDGNLDVLVSPALIAELTDVLGRKKFAAHAAEGRAAAYIAALSDRATMVEDAAPGSPRTADADDDYLIALAQALPRAAPRRRQPHRPARRPAVRPGVPRALTDHDHRALHACQGEAGGP